MNIKRIIVIFCTIFTLSCNKKPNQEILAIIDNEVISLKSVDSILEPQINILRNQVVDGLISQKIIEKEAQKYHITPDEYLRKEIDLKISYSSNQKEVDVNILRRQRFELIIDSLKVKYQINYFLNPFDDPSKFLIHYRGNLNSNISLIVISDFNCPACKWFEQHFDESYKKYMNNVKFGFIFNSDYLSYAALAAEAAGKQNKFWEMHDSLFFKDILYTDQDSNYINLAKELKLDIERFTTDFRNKNNREMIQQNLNRLYCYGIRQTPTFILNNKILPQGIKIDSLKKLIEFKIQNKF